MAPRDRDAARHDFAGNAVAAGRVLLDRMRAAPDRERR